MDFTHYRCDWDHSLADEPVTIFYEVSALGGVPRTIEVFADGRTVCLAVGDFVGRMRDLPGADSFVEGSFFDALAGRELGVVSRTDSDAITISKIPYEEFRKTWCDQRGY